MIKLLKNKLFISMFLLVVCVCITSSCFATSTYSYDDFEISWDTNTLTLKNVPLNISHTYNLASDVSNYSNYIITYCDVNNSSSVYSDFYTFGIVFCNEYSWKTYSGYYYIDVDDGVSCFIDFKKYTGSADFSFSEPWTPASSVISSKSLTGKGGYWCYMFDGDTSLHYNAQIADTSFANITNPYDPVNDLFVNKASTDFDYTLKGVSRNELELAVSNLDSSYSIVGFVNNPTEFSVGDTLNVSSYVNYLRLVSFSDSSVYTCSLYPGETLKYYILDENKTVVDTGVIDELSNGYFLYSYVNETYKGIDYVFLKNGSFYWDDTLDFVWTDPNGYQYHNDQIITIESRVIEVHSDIYSYTVTGIVYDSDGNILGQADGTYFNNQDYLNFEFVHLFYNDYIVLGDVGKFLNNKIHSVYSIKSIMLTGLNSDGSYIDFSNYSVRWSIDTSIISTVESLYVNNSKQSNFFGNFSGFTSNGLTGTLNFSIELNLVYSDYIPFNFVFEIYDSTGKLVHTEVLNSNDFIKTQIDSNKNTGVEKDYYVTDSDKFGKGNNSLNFNDIVNWDEKDYKKLLSSDNFVWQFFITFLNLLPWWISTPLAILIFGVVFISLLKFIRGG